jgi:hypothetical protein
MTDIETPDPLTDAARARLLEFGDALIPGGSGLPSASEADVAGAWIDRTLSANPDLLAVVSTVLARPGNPSEVLRSLRDQDPVEFESFTFAVSGAYFMNPAVRRLFGYPGNAPRRMPAAPGEAEYYLEDDVLGPVTDRGPIYRQAPE